MNLLFVYREGYQRQRERASYAGRLAVLLPVRAYEVIECAIMSCTMD